MIRWIKCQKAEQDLDGHCADILGEMITSLEDRHWSSEYKILACVREIIDEERAGTIEFP